jgi:hypothetical protein
MTAPTVNSQPPVENKTSDKEINFRQQEKAMQDKYERQLALERNARLEAEKQLQERNKKQQYDDEDDDDEPYVNNKKLTKKLNQNREQVIQQTQSDIQKAVQTAVKEERKNNWLNTNKDFYDVIRDHSQKLYEADSELAETILEMPEGFERQKLVYKNIKALGLDKPKEKESSIQDKIDANRRSPSYQPSGMGTNPYSSQSDFSPKGQKQAYDKMQELKSRLRLS